MRVITTNIIQKCLISINSRVSIYLRVKAQQYFLQKNRPGRAWSIVLLDLEGLFHYFTGRIEIFGRDPAGLRRMA
jgi:hypothetical protein